RTELEKVKEEKEGFEFKIAKFEKSAKVLDQLLANQITDKSKKGFGYNAVPSPHPLILNRPTPLDLSYSGLEEFKQPETVTETSSVKYPLKVDKDWKEKFFYSANPVREEEPKKARENTDAPIIEDWVSDDEEEVEPIPKVEKKTAIPTATKKESVKPEKPIRRSVSCPNVHKYGSKSSLNEEWPKTVIMQGLIITVSGCSRHMSRNIAHLSDFQDFDGGYVTFGGGANGGRITSKCTIKTDKLDFEDVYFVKELKFNLFSISQIRPIDGTHDDWSLWDNGTDDQKLIRTVRVNSSRPDIMFAVCACARFQVSPKTSHLLAVKRIFRYLKGKPSLGLWYSKDSPLEFSCLPTDLVTMLELHFVGITTGKLNMWLLQVAVDRVSSDNRFFNQKSPFARHCTKKPEVCVSFIKQFWRSAEASNDENGEVKINDTIDGHSLSINEGSLRRHINSRSWESQIRFGKARRQARVVLSDDEAFKDDSSKQGRKLSDEEVQEKASTDTELFIQEVTPYEVIASEEVPKVVLLSTLLVLLEECYLFKKECREKDQADKEKHNDRGEPKKKSKKELEIERLSYVKLSGLVEQMNVEQRAQMHFPLGLEQGHVFWGKNRDFLYYQVFRGDGSLKNYKILSEMLEDFDRLDVEELFFTDEDDEIWIEISYDNNLLSGEFCRFLWYPYFVDGKWIGNSYVDREEVSFKPRDVNKDVKRIISRGRRLEDFIQKKLDDLKDNHIYTLSMPVVLLNTAPSRRMDSMLLVKVAELKLRMHGDYLGDVYLNCNDPK
ncbi:hypothetical protein Tco_0546507, partial [Tanacetum coccineum]